jgi:hypothetical protein
VSGPAAGTLALRSELDALLAAVARMAQLAQDGGLVDIVSLEEAVAGFCSRVAAAPAETVVALRNGMVALLDDLARLDATMRQTHAALGQRIGEMAQRRRATAAYGTQGRRPR